MTIGVALAGLMPMGPARVHEARADVVDSATAARWYWDFMKTPSIVARGPAVIVDGDTIKMQGIRIRLDGIDAPEPRDTCGTASDGHPIFCGRLATAALARLAGDWVVCDIVGADVKYPRLVGRCRARGGEELSAAMVELGYARATSEDLVLRETAARSAKAGLWDPAFTLPSAWR